VDKTGEEDTASETAEADEPQPLDFATGNKPDGGHIIDLRVIEYPPPDPPTSPIHRTWAAITVAAAAAGAVTSDAAPTGGAIIDAVIVALFGAVVAWLAMRHHRVLTLPLLLVGFATFSLVWTAVLFAGALIPFRPGERLGLSPRNRVGIAAAIGISAVLRIGSLGFFGLPSLLTIAALAPLLIAELRGRRRPTTSRTAWAYGTPATALGLLYLLTLGVTVQNIQIDVNEGSAALQAAAQAAGSGDSTDMLIDLERADRAFRRADRRLDSSSARIGRLIPGLAQQIRAADTVLTQTAVLSGTARQSGPLIYPDIIYAQSGWIAFDLLDRTRRGVDEFHQIVDQSATNIEATPRAWLLPQLDGAVDDAVDQLNDLSDTLTTVEQGLATVPHMLGADDEQRILVLLTTPAETRERGGFVGAYALLSAKRDGLDIIASGPVANLRQAVQQFNDPSPFSDWYLRYDHARYPQNLTASPSLRTTFDAVQQVLPALEGKPIDTVAYIDPAGMSAFVEAIGSVRLPRSPRVLDSDEILDFLLREQYLYWPDTTQQSQLLSELFEDVFLEFMATGLPAPERIQEIFGDAVRGGHIAVVTGDDPTNGFLTDVSLQRDFPGPIDGDFVSVVQVNGAPSKLDAYLRRHVHYQAAVDPSTGLLQGTVTVTLTSDAPRDLPDYVVAGGSDGSRTSRFGAAPRATGHRVLLSLYTPHLVTAASIDGRLAELAQFDEYGLTRAMTQVDFGLGTTATVTFRVFGEVPTGDYTIRIAQQPLATPDTMTIDVIGLGGWTLEPDTAPIDALPLPDSDSSLVDDEADAETEADTEAGPSDSALRVADANDVDQSTSDANSPNRLDFTVTANLDIDYRAIRDDL
jgi:hypothetical protein